MGEVRVNVRSRGGSSGKPDFEVLHPRFPPFPRRPISRLPHRHPSHPPPVFSHFLVASSSLGLGDLQEQAGVASRRGWRRDERGGRGGGRGLSLSLDQYSHLLPAGPGRTLRSEAHLLADIQPPFLRNRAHLHPRSWSTLLFLPFRPAATASWPANPLSANPRDLHPPRRAEAFARKKIFRLALTISRWIQRCFRKVGLY